MTKKDMWIVYTPPVELGFCWLQRPDDKFGEPAYKAEFFLTPAQAKTFADTLESDPRAIIDKKPQKLKGTKSDGKVKFRAKQQATITWKDSATGETQTKDIKPRLLHIVDGETVDYKGGYPKAGSIGELELEVRPYSSMGGGLGLRLRGVRFHSVIEGESSSKSTWGEPAFDGEPVESTEPTGSDKEGDDDRNW